MLNLLIALLLHANFTAGDDIPPAMMLNGAWTRDADGLLVGEDGASFHVDAAWTDFTYHIDFLLLESGAVHLVSRANAENPCEGFQIIFVEHEARLSGISGAGCEQETTLAVASIQPTEVFSVRVELVGGAIRVFLNNEPILNGMSSRFPSGGIGLFLEDSARVAISSVLVEASDGAPGLLAAFDADPNELLAELRVGGLIPEKGRMLFEENRVFVRGGGYNVIPLAPNSPRADFVLGGELYFRRGSSTDPEACIIAARADRDIESAVSLRVMDSGAVIVADEESGGFAVRSLSLDISEPRHILMILDGTQMTVYIDGQLTFESLPVAEREGVFALAGRGNGLNFRCDLLDMWVYEFDP